MSITIHDAYLLPSNVNIANVMAWAVGHREKIEDLLADAWEGEICASACEMLDRMIVRAAGLAGEGEGDTRELWSSLLDHARNNLEKTYSDHAKQGRRFPGLDTEVKMAILQHEGRCYAKLMCDSKPVREYFHALEGMEDFSYWDNCDQPDGLSDKQWDARGRLWNDLVPSHDFMTDGMMIFIRREGDVPQRRIDPANIANHLRPLERRACDATYITPISNEIYQREGAKTSLIIKMAHGEFEQFNQMRDRIQALLPENAAVGSFLSMPASQLQAAICELVMKAGTKPAAATCGAPRI